MLSISFRSCFTTSSPSRPAASWRMGPTAGHGAELQLALSPFQASQFVGLNLVFQILGGLEQRGFERVVPGLGVEGRAMNQLRGRACMAGRLGVQARTGYFQVHLDAEGRLGFPLVFKDYFGVGDRSQAKQVLKLFLHLAVPSSLGVEAQISKRGFHIYSGTDFWAQVVEVERLAASSSGSLDLDLLRFGLRGLG
jgi:hypothetical protein